MSLRSAAVAKNNRFASLPALRAVDSLWPGAFAQELVARRTAEAASIRPSARGVSIVRRPVGQLSFVTHVLGLTSTSTAGSSRMPLSMPISWLSNQRCRVATQRERLVSKGSTCPTRVSHIFRVTPWLPSWVHHWEKLRVLTFRSCRPW